MKGLPRDETSTVPGLGPSRLADSTLPLDSRPGATTTHGYLDQLWGATAPPDTTLILAWTPSPRPGDFKGAKPGLDLGIHGVQGTVRFSEPGGCRRGQNTEYPSKAIGSKAHCGRVRYGDSSSQVGCSEPCPWVSPCQSSTSSGTRRIGSIPSPLKL